MHGLKNEHKQSINLALNGGDEVGDGGEGARGGRPLAKRWTAGPTTSSNQ